MGGCVPVLAAALLGHVELRDLPHCVLPAALAPSRVQVSTYNGWVGVNAKRRLKSWRCLRAVPPTPTRVHTLARAPDCDARTAWPALHVQAPRATRAPACRAHTHCAASCVAVCHSCTRCSPALRYHVSRTQPGATTMLRAFNSLMPIRRRLPLRGLEEFVDTVTKQGQKPVAGDCGCFVAPVGADGTAVHTH